LLPKHYNSFFAPLISQMIKQSSLVY
jgi:hypothetical protein